MLVSQEDFDAHVFETCAKGKSSLAWYSIVIVSLKVTPQGSGTLHTGTNNQHLRFISGGFR